MLNDDHVIFRSGAEVTTVAFHAMFNGGLEKILSADQLAQWDTHSGKALKTGGCPLMNSDSGKTGKQT